MNARNIKKRIAECATLFGFEHGGKYGNVDPCYDAEKDVIDYLLFFDGLEQTVQSIEEVMETPFIDGKTLTEAADKLTITEW